MGKEKQKIEREREKEIELASTQIEIQFSSLSSGRREKLQISFLRSEEPNRTRFRSSERSRAGRSSKEHGFHDVFFLCMSDVCQMHVGCMSDAMRMGFLDRSVDVHFK